MAPIYKEAAFPVSYRRAEAGQILRSLYCNRSIAVTGLAGMGKSNLLRFVVSHPLARTAYLAERVDHYAFVPVDCTGLLSGDEAEILDEIWVQLQRQGLAPASSLPAAEPRVARRLLEEQILRLDPPLTVVLVFDDFDAVSAHVGKPFFNYLAHLRNSRPLGNLLVILATRRPLGSVYDLQELLDDPCVVGPFTASDALASILRDEQRLNCRFEPALRERLAACTGGHPGLLKNACEVVSATGVDPIPSIPDLTRRLLRSDKVVHMCEELWSDLLPAEQAALSALAQERPLVSEPDANALKSLEQSGLVKVGEAGRGSWQAFSPLFAAYLLERVHGQGPVQIVAEAPNRARLAGAMGEVTVELPPLLFAVLQVLAGRPGQVVTTDELIAGVYGDPAQGVSNEALAQLVKRLREVLDPRLRELASDPALTCVATIRGVGYRLTG